MAYKIVTSDYSSTIWLKFIQPTDFKNILDDSLKQLGTFSPITNWEQVFAIGDKINKELKLNEENIVNEVISYRKKSKS